MGEANNESNSNEGYISRDQDKLEFNPKLTSSDFGLVWEDQPEDMQQQLVKEIPVFSFEPKLSITSDDPNRIQHVLIEGDNLHALHTLQATHKGKIDLIYIDPPYNTGNKDFRYDDKYIDDEDLYKHSKWLSFMSKRLNLAEKLLSDDGAIFVSIDDNEYPRLYLLMESIFGEKNIKTIVVKMSEATGVKMASVLAMGRIPKLKEYVIVAKKNGIRDLFIEKIPKEKWDEQYKYFLTNATEEEIAFVKEVKDSESRSQLELDRANSIVSNWKYVSLSKYFKENSIEKGRQDDFKYQNSSRIFRSAALEGGAKKKAVEMAKDYQNRPNFFFIVTSKNKCYLIDGQPENTAALTNGKILFADEYLTIHPGDFWSDIKTTGLAAEGGVDFKNGKKPLKLVERIIKSILKPEATVLDFFAGSGTTLHATLNLNQKDGGSRRCILVTNNENNICRDVTRVRVANALKEQGSAQNKDNSGALQYYTTDFILRKKNIDQMRADIADHTVELISLKDGAVKVKALSDSVSILQNRTELIAVCTSPLTKHTSVFEKVSALANEGQVKKAYLFTWSDNDVEEEVKSIWVGWEVEPLPAHMLAALRKYAPQSNDLFADQFEEGDF